MSKKKKDLDIEKTEPIEEAKPIEDTAEETTGVETRQHPAVTKVLLGKAISKAVLDALHKTYENQTTPVTEEAITEISSHLAAVALGEQFNPNRWSAIADSAKVAATFLNDIMQQSQQQGK